MIEKERCSYARIGGESFMNCREVKEEVNTDEGSLLGWLGCFMASSSFTYGCEYDWIKDACECRGPIISPIWRR